MGNRQFAGEFPAVTAVLGAALLLIPPIPAKGQDAMPTTAPAAKLRAVPFTEVKITDKFWAPRLETNRRVSLAHSLDMLEKSGNIKDLELAASGARTGYAGPVFIDSDLYKALEAISYSLSTHPDPQLETRMDGIIAKIAAAQQPDGYLNTWYTVNAPERRWKNLRDDHELYCAGHLFEAAAAHFQATGKRTLLDVATKFADYIDSVFGSNPGKRMGYCGHPEIELALVKLARATANPRYFELARFFVDSRGSKFFATEHGTDLSKYNGEYWQDNVPIRDHKKIVGHAVRACYLLSGATDLAAETGDAGLLNMLDRVWHNTVDCNMYVTGGIGSSAANEGFTTDYDLPNRNAYQETCASIAMIQWNHRLNLLSGDGKYADVMERAMYNGFLAGISLDGKRFFYVNPLASDGRHHRQDWFGCACCPPNVTRTLAQLGGYMYASAPGMFRVNLYAGSSVRTTLDDRKLALDVETDYPWSGDVRMKVSPESPARFALQLRVPEWCGEGKAAVRVNGTPVDVPRMKDGYLQLDQEWKPGDEVALTLPMEVRKVAAHPQVAENVGKVALQRGPLVYCLEQVDQEAKVSSIALPRSAAIDPALRPDLFAGIVTLTGSGLVGEPQPGWGGRLYGTAGDVRPVKLTAIPYYLWDNRTPGEMAVWLPEAPPPNPTRTEPNPPETKAAGGE